MLEKKLKIKAFLQFAVFCLVASIAAFSFDYETNGSPRVSKVDGVESSDATTRARLDDKSINSIASSKNEYELVSVDKTLSYPGFTLLPVSGTAETLLLNQSGEVVHRWPLDAERARLLENCNLLVLHGSKWGYRQKKWRDLKFSLREYDWNSKEVWNFPVDEWAHHDVAVTDEGNYVFIKRTTVEAPADYSLGGKVVNNLGIRSDTILEVNKQGDKVWEWNVHDHFDMNKCDSRPCDYLEVRDVKAGSSKFKGDLASQIGIEKITDWSHTNTATIIPENKWYAEGDERFKPGNLLIIIRNFWTAYIVEKESGQIVWRYDGKAKDVAPEDALVRGHDIYMIPQDLPGAGNLLVFDNGHEDIRSFSRILEVNPVTKEIVWDYSDPDLFFSNAAGSIQRLPNGNTLISEDKSGRVFEVTKDKKIVWDLRGPHRISRAQRYDLSYCPELSKLVLK